MLVSDRHGLRRRSLWRDRDRQDPDPPVETNGARRRIVVDGLRFRLRGRRIGVRSLWLHYAGEQGELQEAHPGHDHGLPGNPIGTTSVSRVGLACYDLATTRGRAVRSARQAHNLQVGGSNPPRAMVGPGHKGAGPPVRCRRARPANSYLPTTVALIVTADRSSPSSTSLSLPLFPCSSKALMNAWPPTTDRPNT